MNAPALESPPSPPKKRAWSQLHLSTCVVLMFAAGALVWVNVAPRLVYVDYTGYEAFFIRGWPLPIMSYDQHVTGTFAKSESGAGPRLSDYAYIVSDDLGNEYEQIPYGRNTFINCTVACAALLALAVVCEALIRRRERKRAGRSA